MVLPISLQELRPGIESLAQWRDPTALRTVTLGFLKARNWTIREVENRFWVL